MMIACPDCHLQYDVSDHPDGSRVRCRCDTVLTVATPVAHEPRPLRCGGCGGPLSDGERDCRYCGDHVSLDELRLGSVCPECFARTAKDARYCMECGVELAPQFLAPLPHRTDCPRCQGKLHARSVGQQSLVECASCAGLWIRPKVFEELCQQAEQHRTDLLGFEDEPASEGLTRYHSTVNYLPCVVCEDLMVRRNFGGVSGVIIDVCRNHGAWLDHCELEKVLGFIQRGGMSRSRERDLRENEDRARRAPRNTANMNSIPSATLLLGEAHSPDVYDAVRWIGHTLARLF